MALLAVAATIAACGSLDNGELTDEEWRRLQSMSTGRVAFTEDAPPGLEELILAADLPARVRGLGLPPADCSNAFTWNPFISDLSSCPDVAADPSRWIPNESLAEVIKLGRKLYFDPGFSGPTTHEDILRRVTSYGRPEAVAGSVRVSCATCHDPSRDGIDRSDLTLADTGGAVSIGAGIYDVNSQPTINAAYYKIFYWNGRSDALWSQIAAVNESTVSMNSRRNMGFWKVWNDYWADGKTIDALPIFSRGLSNAQIAALPPGLNDRARYPLGDPVPVTPVGATAFICRKQHDEFRDTVTRVYVNFAKLIAAYEQTLVRADSTFDRWVAEGRTSTAMSPAARRGARLFVGKAACFDCHNGPLFSDSKFHNVGVPQVGTGVPTFDDCGASCTCRVDVSTNEPTRRCAPWGAWDGLGRLRQGRFRRDTPWSDSLQDDGDLTVQNFLRDTGIVRGEPAPPPSPDAGCPPKDDVSAPLPAAAPMLDRSYGIPEQLGPELVGAWRTPTLRDVASTAPYMHNGVYRTLDDVVWHYNIGGTVGTLDQQARRSVQITPLDLTEDEQRDLVEFLHALTSQANLPPRLISPGGTASDGGTAADGGTPDGASPSDGRPDDTGSDPGGGT